MISNISSFRYPSAKRHKRTLVSDALPDAIYFRLLTGFSGLVPDADGPGDAEEPAHQLGSHCQVASDTQTFLVEEVEEGGRVVLAQQRGNHRTILNLN
jgi:hypothetical protein